MAFDIGIVDVLIPGRQGPVAAIFTGTSSTELTAGVGSHLVTLDAPATMQVSVGQRLRLADMSPSPNVIMDGDVAGWDPETGEFTLEVDVVPYGIGETSSSWNISIVGAFVNSESQPFAPYGDLEATNTLDAIKELEDEKLSKAENLADLTDASDARTNLGLGTMAVQNANNVMIIGGAVSGITDLAVADGGTGASDASGARTNLGLVIGTDVQAFDADLSTIGGLAKTDGNFIVADGADWTVESGATARTSLGLGSIATQAANNVTITGGSISGITDLAVADGGTGASDASGARTNLGLVIGTNVQAWDADLDALASMSKTDGNFAVANGTTFVAESGATARTSLGLGSIATQASSNVTITGGSISGITDLAIADGGTAASSAAAAFANLKQAATETETGVVELATESEALAGVDTTRVITPATLAAAIEDFEPGGGSVSGLDPVDDNFDCSANPNFPAADALDMYVVGVAGRIGGASGVLVSVGDVFICKNNGTPSGTLGDVGTNWTVLVNTGSGSGGGVGVGGGSFEDRVYQLSEWLDPVLVQDFAKDGVDLGSPTLWTFTGPAGRTYYDRFGILTTAGENEPRFDHDPETKAALGALILGGGTQSMLRTEDLSNASWTKTNATISTDDATAPDNTLTMDKIVENTSSGAHSVTQAVASLTKSSPLIFSVYLRADERSKASLSMSDGSNAFEVTFDLVTGTNAAATTLSGTGGSSRRARIQEAWPFDGSCWRCAIQGVIGSGTGTVTFGISMSNGSSLSYTGDGASGLHAWGGNVRPGTTPITGSVLFVAPYVAATSAAVTHAAENLTCDLAGLVNPTQCGVVAEFVCGSHADGTRVFSINDGGATTENIRLSKDSAGAFFYNAVHSGSGSGAQIGTRNDLQVQVAALGLRGGDNAGSLDGGAAVSISNSYPTGLDTLYIGREAGDTNYWNGWIRGIAVLPARPNDEAVVRLSTPVTF